MILQSIRLVSLLGAPEQPSRMRREFARLVRDLFGEYRPERHYMRGPGPACLARQSVPQQIRLQR